MSVRGIDAWDHLLFKETLVESDHEAIFSDGRRQPVYFRTKNGKCELFIELDCKWANHADAVKYGLVRYERIPEVQLPVFEAPPTESRKIQGSTTAEIMRNAEAQARANLNAQYAAHQAQQGIPIGDPRLADAAYRDRQIVASQKGRRH
jgi:hypothetical protein